MKLIIIRHADPDYEKDSLTPLGWKEAKLLANRMSQLDVKAFYVSPLGRAKDTANCTLDKMGRTAEEKDWLREFYPVVNRPNVGKPMGAAWDWLPQDWTMDPRFYDINTWTDVEQMKEANVAEAYQYVCESFDALLAEHGYVRENNYYRVEKANSDTIVLFCHFGLECVLLSHLMNVSPMPLWHGMCAPTSSVTTIYTEERRKGIASFRINSFGDTSHLYAAGQEPSFAARFCECYDNEKERHD